MSVCYQQDIVLPGFRHLFTTSQKLITSVGVQGIMKSYGVYEHSDTPERISRIETNGLYKVHY